MAYCNVHKQTICVEKPPDYHANLQCVCGDGQWVPNEDTKIWSPWDHRTCGNLMGQVCGAKGTGEGYGATDTWNHIKHKCCVSGASGASGLIHTSSTMGAVCKVKKAVTCNKVCKLKDYDSDYNECIPKCVKPKGESHWVNSTCIEDCMGLVADEDSCDSRYCNGVFGATACATAAKME